MRFALLLISALAVSQPAMEEEEFYAIDASETTGSDATDVMDPSSEPEPIDSLDDLHQMCTDFGNEHLKPFIERHRGEVESRAIAKANQILGYSWNTNTCPQVRECQEQRKTAMIQNLKSEWNMLI